MGRRITPKVVNRPSLLKPHTHKHTEAHKGRGVKPRNLCLVQLILCKSRGSEKLKTVLS